MSKCPFPDCFLDEEHEGLHQIGRPPFPRGTLRRTQEFMQNAVLTPPCDLHNIPKGPKARPAIGMYIDMLGFGWQLCYGCVQSFGAVEDLAPAPAKPAPSDHGDHARSRRFRRSDKVIEFRSRNGAAR